jgi:ribonuclease P protein component
MISQGKAPGTRLGITVSRKVGNAVKRNRIKRWIREVFRSHPALFSERVDIVVIAKRNIEDFSFENIREEFIDVVGRFFEGREQRSRSQSSYDREPSRDRKETS